MKAVFNKKQGTIVVTSDYFDKPFIRSAENFEELEHKTFTHEDRFVLTFMEFSYNSCGVWITNYECKVTGNTIQAVDVDFIEY